MRSSRLPASRLVFERFSLSGVQIAQLSLELTQQQDLKKKRKTIFQSAAKYVKEYQSSERNLIRMRRQARDNGNYFIEPSPKVVFVVRIRGSVSPLHSPLNSPNPLPIPVTPLLPPSDRRICSGLRCPRALTPAPLSYPVTADRGCAVSTVLTPRPARFCNCCACARSTTASSSASTRPPLTCSAPSTRT